MIAQEMADTANRGRVLWLLASSRPDLIEVDLKRPGRVDVKVPLLPTSTQAESAALVGMLAKRYGSRRRMRELATLHAADADAADSRRCRSAGRQSVSALAHEKRRRRRRARSLPRRLSEPVPADVLEFQMRIAIREATDLAFVPPAFRKYAAQPRADMSAKRSYLAQPSTRVPSACRCRRTGSASRRLRCSARS
jgi:hypothetical protein